MPEIPQAIALGFNRPGLAGAVLTSGVPAAGAAAVPAPAIAELRLIALFVAKWKLEASKTKTLLAVLTPQRRRYVMQHFKALGVGDAATTELENFIGECGRSGSWDQGAITVQPTQGQVGVKRPLLVNPSFDPSKRPRLGVPAVAPQAQPGMSLAQRLAAARAASPGPRPVQVVRPLGQIRPLGMPRPIAPRPAVVRPPGMGMVRPFGQPVPARIPPGGYSSW
jgi:hypothetical protein